MKPALPSLGLDSGDRKKLHGELQLAAGPGIHAAQQVIAMELLWRFLAIKSTEIGFEGKQVHLWPIKDSEMAVMLSCLIYEERHVNIQAQACRMSAVSITHS